MENLITVAYRRRRCRPECNRLVCLYWCLDMKGSSVLVLFHIHYKVQGHFDVFGRENILLRMLCSDSVVLKRSCPMSCLRCHPTQWVVHLIPFFDLVSTEGSFCTENEWLRLPSQLSQPALVFPCTNNYYQGLPTPSFPPSPICSYLRRIGGEGRMCKAH